MINDTLSVLKKKGTPDGFIISFPRAIYLTQLQTLYEASLPNPLDKTELFAKAKRHGYSEKLDIKDKKSSNEELSSAKFNEKIQQMG